MSTTARITFRGLTAFLWDDSGQQMAAVLVSGPVISNPKRPRHEHVPRISWVGYNAKSGQSKRASARIPTAFDGTLWFNWTKGNIIKSPTKVTKSAEFPKQIPRFAQLVGAGYKVKDKSKLFLHNKEADLNILNSTIAAVVISEAGNIDVTEPIAFWRHSNRGGPSVKWPQIVDFLGVSSSGGKKATWATLASECELVMTNDADDAKLEIITADDGKIATLQSLRGARRPPNRLLGHPAKGHPVRHDLPNPDPVVDPNPDPSHIGVLITNYSPRIQEPLPYSTHYQWFFDLLEKPPNPKLGTAFSKLVADYKNRHGGKGWRWSDHLEDDVKDLFSGAAVPKYPFPYFCDPTDHEGVAIKDWEDREMCPFIDGE